MSTRRDFLIGMAVAGVAAATSSRVIGAVPNVPRKGPSRRAPGVVQTVLGLIAGTKLGFTLPHEHLCPSSAGFWQVWPEFFGGRRKFIDLAVAKLQALKGDGVDTIVDVTTADLGRDIRLMEEVSRKSGMQIIACTGHWLHPSLSMDARTVDELTEFFTLEIERGIEGTDIKPGVIKVATEEVVTPFLENSLRAAARASKATGIPVTTHTYARAPVRGGEKQAAIFEQEGLSPAMVCLGHSDESNDMGYLTGLAKRGYTLGMDHMPIVAQDDVAAQAKLLTWKQRADSIKKLVDAGFVDKIFLSNDWFFGVSMAPTGSMDVLNNRNPDGMRFGTRRAIPYLRHIGVSESAIRSITVDNPRRFFGSA